MRVGLIGTGRIGTAHAAALAAHPAVAEVLLADADPARARAVAGASGGRAVDAAAVLAPGAVDALVIAAATDAHAGLVTAGIELGLPVFCEKPVAPDVPATIAVLRAAEKAAALVHIGFMRRFDAGHLRARAALRSGELGELHRVHAATCDPAPPPAEYVPTSGGIFRDCHVHDFDALRWITGREITEVTAYGANRGAEFFAAAGDVDTTAAVLRLDDGTLATLQGSRYNGAGYDVRMELAGTRGTIAVGLDDRTPVRSAEEAPFPVGAPWPDFPTRFGPAYRAEIDAFLRAAAAGGPSPCTVADALEAVLAADAADRSRREGRPVLVAEVRPGL